MENLNEIETKDLNAASIETAHNILKSRFIPQDKKENLNLKLAILISEAMCSALTVGL